MIHSRIRTRLLINVFRVAIIILSSNCFEVLYKSLITRKKLKIYSFNFQFFACFEVLALVGIKSIELQLIILKFVIVRYSREYVYCNSTRFLEMCFISLHIGPTQLVATVGGG